MNYNTLCPGAKLIKKLQNFHTGQMVTSGEVSNIAIITTGCSGGAKKLAENVSAGVRASGGVAHIFQIPALGFCNKVNPLTAKYAQSFARVSADSTEAIIKTNMIDGVVIISDCEITVRGALLACIRANCACVVLPTGIMRTSSTKILKINGEVAVGRKVEDIDALIAQTSAPSGMIEGGGAVTFFTALEKLEVVMGGSVLAVKCSGAQAELAYKAGEQAVRYAKDILSPRKLLTKAKFSLVATEMLNSPTEQAMYSLAGLDHVLQLVKAVGEKIPHSFFADLFAKAEKSPIILLKGSVCENGGYAQPTASTPIKFSAKAWVYYSLEDADVAVSKGSINGGVVVLHNCYGMDISQIIYTIEGTGKGAEFAVITDGYCEPTDVLVVTKCSPNSLENEDFANIQTGDVIDIDLGKGKVNTSVMAKDMKIRMKKNSVKKQSVYFS